MKYRFILVVGARPNFMKAAPILDELKKYKEIETILLHTGQHYDEKLSDVFFRSLTLPRPQIHLGIGSGTHAQQTAKIMLAFEKLLMAKKPHLVIVVGDVNSTLAGALATAKFRCLQKSHLPLIVHIEAGLRSFDHTMPEEINRKLTDSLSDLLFITESSAMDNLRKEGIDSNRVFHVGNVMIDSLVKCKKQANASRILKDLDLKKGNYAVLTMHRPINVDDRKNFAIVTDCLEHAARKIPVVFPIHPRTAKMLKKFDISIDFLNVIEPLGYLDFLKVMMNAKFVLTDSGGIQEETTFLGIPCLTLRNNTERPVTVSRGTNVLVGQNPTLVADKVNQIMKGKFKKGSIPKFWDGKAAQRICKVIYNHLKHLA